MVEEEADIEETEATWEDDTQTKTNVSQKYLLNKSEWMCVGWKTGVRIGEIWGKGTGPDGKDSLKFI